MKRVMILAAIAAVTAAAARADNGIVHASVSARESHNGTYNVAARPQADGSWLFDIRTAAGAPVDNASVYAFASMPLTEIADRVHRRAYPMTAGVYSVDSLATEVSGWWNVKLTINSAAGMDSVAFNVTVR